MWGVSADQHGKSAMKPVAYTSLGTTSTHYLTKTLLNSKIVVVVVPNGIQPRDGHIFPNMNEAISWLKDNGFTEVRK